MDGLLIVDKPGGMTSHDVVARVRRISGIRKVGHAGTLDPMATGVLVLGVGKATKLLGQLTLTTKAYEAVIRLGQSTVTDDAEGESLSQTSATHVSVEDIEKVLVGFRGDIMQVPSSVSAIKVGGRRSYARVRAGEKVELPPRSVTVSHLEISGPLRVVEPFLDVAVSVECSSGTYIRALARDIGAELRVGGHLTELRRTRVGPYGISQATTLDDLQENFQDYLVVL